MGHTDGVRSGFDKLPHFCMDFAHVAPVDGAFHGVHDQAEILHGIAHVRVVESALLPALCHITGQRQAAVLAAYPFGMLSQILRKPLLPVGKGEEEAHLAFLKAF